MALAGEQALVAGADLPGFAAEEDFGIVPVEAQACGTPVIAFGRGGVRDSVRDIDSHRPTRLLFESQTATDVAAAVRRFEAESHHFLPENCRENALRFSLQMFRARFRALVEREWAILQTARRASEADGFDDAVPGR